MRPARFSRRAVIGVALAAPTLSRAQEMQVFDAILHEGSAERGVGRVALDQRGRLTIVSAAPDRAEWLGRVQQEANAAETMQADAPPPPGAPPSTDAGRIVRRTDADFTRVLRDYLRTYYGLELRPAQG